MPQLNLRGVLFASFLAVLPMGAARADSIYLTGALSFGSDALGNNTSNPGEYDTFNALTGNSNMNIGALTQGGVSSILLLPGSNTFVANTGYAPTVALGLYFSSTASRSYAFSEAPDLVAIDVSGSGLAFGSTGAQVGNYGQVSGLSTYAGNTSFILGDKKVTVTDLSLNSGAAGTITFEVTDVGVAAPTPAIVPVTLCLFALGASLNIVRRRSLAQQRV